MFSKNKILITVFIMLSLSFVSSTASAFWGNVVNQTNSIIKNVNFNIGNWCFGGCKLYDPNATYKRGDIILIRNNGTEETVVALKDVASGHHTNPNTINKYAKFPKYKDDIWYSYTNNTYVAHEHYFSGDVVFYNDNLYVYSGDLRHQTWRGRGRCRTPKHHDPFNFKCWAHPGQTKNMYGNIHWILVNSNLSLEQKQKYYSKKQLYYKDDVAYIYNGNYYNTDNAGYITSGNINTNNLLKCTMINDTTSVGRGVVGERTPISNPRWSCSPI